MGFFREIFNKHVYPLNRFISRDDLRSAINLQSSFPALLDTLGKDTLLRNEVIREMVCFSTLVELYSDKGFNKRNILDILRQAVDNSKFPKHRRIASNLIHELTVMKENQPAPDFTLPILSEDSLVSLADMSGKPIYIGFFTTWSFACLAEFELMKDRYLEYGDHIQFVTIALDRDPDIVKKFKAEKKYDWTFLYNGLDYDLIFDYRIKTFPSFVLIGSDGNIADYPAYKPSEIINERFDLLIRKQKQKESMDPDSKR
jgi:thiol-disulfide isomerase/thioredoxin